MDLRDKRFLVIGGAGFIGSHLVEELLKEGVREIVLYDNFSRGTLENLQFALKDPRVKIFPSGGDLLHRDILKDAMKDVDGVFLLAALWLLHCQQYMRSAFEVNVGGVFNVLEALAQQGVKRLVFSSSASVYGDAMSDDPMTEEHPYNNTNFYGATKICGEHLCRAYYHRHRGTDQRFDYVGLRYMNVYGPRQDYKGAYVAVIMKILDRLEQGLPPVLHGTGTQSYDFIYVQDCARANVCAMKADTTDQFYNVGTGVKTSLLELTQTILEVTGSKSEIVFEPETQSFVKSRLGSPVKSQKEIGFAAKVPLRDGIARLVEWRREHKKRSEGQISKPAF